MRKDSRSKGPDRLQMLTCLICLPGRMAAPGLEGSLQQLDALGTHRSCPFPGGGKKCGVRGQKDCINNSNSLFQGRGGLGMGKGNHIFFLPGSFGDRKMTFMCRFLDLVKEEL